ncbi:MAG: hypothetical protein KDK70_09980 [Myxococcales bacterium]|nr:hypothetical protein [Myxococcales bacterium]
MSSAMRLGGVALLVLLGLGGCTDGRSPAAQAPPGPHDSMGSLPSQPPSGSPSEASPGQRNSDGSLKQLPPGPPSRPPQTLVMRYDDFGPQALAGTLLGAEWWQWAAGGSWEIDDRFDVRVVVYRGIDREQVAAEYPTVEGRADYRYVTYDEALEHFDRAIVDIEGVPELARLRAELIASRSDLVRAMGPRP